MALTPRSWLWMLQLVGGVSLLVYPGVLLANLMSLAAPPNPDPGVFDFLVKAFLWVTLAYPLLWAGLWWLSWRFFRAGRTPLAFALAMPPAFGTAALAAAMTWMSGQGVVEQREIDEARMRARDGAAAENPIAGAILSFEAGESEWPQLRGVIESATAESLSAPVTRPIPEFPGMALRDPDLKDSPLGLLLRLSEFDRSLESAKTRPYFLDAARLMLARGAKLSAEEVATDVKMGWMVEVLAQGITLPDEKAAALNPLSARIMHAFGIPDEQAATRAAYDLAHASPEMLGRPAGIYGTPLHAALVSRHDRIVESLISLGAIVTRAERDRPSIAHALEQYFAAPLREQSRAAFEERFLKASR